MVGNKILHCLQMMGAYYLVIMDFFKPDASFYYNDPKQLCMQRTMFSNISCHELHSEHYTSINTTTIVFIHESDPPHLFV